MIKDVHLTEPPDGSHVIIGVIKPQFVFQEQQGQGVEVLFGMAVGAGVQRLRQRAFRWYDRVWKLMCMGCSFRLVWLL